MSGASPGRSRFFNCHEAGVRRGHRDSDATLTDFHHTESPESMYHGPGYRCDEREQEHPGHDGFDRQYYDYRPNQHQNNQVGRGSLAYRHSSTPNSNATRLRQPSPLKQESSRNYTDSYDDSWTGSTENQDYEDYRNSQQKRRSVRFSDDNYNHCFPITSSSPSRRVQRIDPSSLSADPRYSRGKATRRDPSREGCDDYDYGYIQDEEEYDDRYGPQPTGSRHNVRDYQDDNNVSSLPQPVTAPQLPSVGVPYGFLPFVMPQKKKKASLTKRIKQAFIAMAANPDDVTLGCKPGSPTPRHILEKETEEKTTEEQKHQEQRRRKDEHVRQSMLRRQTSYNSNARIAEERGWQLRTRAQPNPREIQRGSGYDACIAEEDDRERARFREYDDTHDHRTTDNRRRSRQGGQESRYQYST